MISTILIIGAGQAGSQAVDTLRRQGFGGRLVLIGDEPELPYQRPPLSKKYLSGELAQERLLLRHRAFYEEHRTELLLGSRGDPLGSTAPQRHARGRRPIELRPLAAVSRRAFAALDLSRPASSPACIICATWRMRRRCGLRSRPSARVVIIGGGYIGLETAATCRKQGCDVTVLEMADRVMNRVVAPDVSAIFCRGPPGARRRDRLRDARGRHRARTGTAGHGAHLSVACADGRPSGGSRRRRRRRRRDHRTRAARPAWLATTASRSMSIAAPAIRRSLPPATAPTIFAAYGRRVRLESVDNAFEQGKTAAFKTCWIGRSCTTGSPGSGPISSTTSC
jgi:3-phenylpropionate/trans-cinnamate dioxygenase ferredoxin reductase component